MSHVEMYGKTTTHILYDINCASVVIAKEIEPAIRGNVTQGIPDLYTFKALPAYRKPIAIDLRNKVAKVIRERRKSGAA